MFYIYYQLLTDALIVAKHLGVAIVVSFKYYFCLFIYIYGSFIENLEPVYEEVANAFAHAKKDILIAKIDADDTGRKIAKSFNIKGFPS